MKTREALTDLGVNVELVDYFDEAQFDRADLVHLFGSDYVYGQATEILAARGIPYVVSSVFYPVGLARAAHNALSKARFTQSWLRRRVLRAASMVLPNSTAEARLISAMFGVETNRLRIVPNGISLGIQGASPDRFRRVYLPDLASDERFVLSVGRIEKRKNTLHLLAACERVGVPAVLIGKPVEREHTYVRRVLERVRRLGQRAVHIPFLPHTSSDLADAYAAAHVHALVSDLETPGLASLEAGLNGANLVVSSSPPVMEYLGEHAWVTKNRKVASIEDAIREAVQAPRDARAASAHVLGHYTWESAAQSTYEAYLAVLGVTNS